MRWIKLDWYDHFYNNEEIEDQLCADYRWNGINEPCDMLKLEHIEKTEMEMIFHYN